MKIGPTTPAATDPPCSSPTIDPRERVPNIMLPSVPRVGMTLPNPMPNSVTNGIASAMVVTVTNCR